VAPLDELPQTTESEEDAEAEVPTGPHLIATFKSEDVTNDGQDVGPVSVWDTVEERVVWQSDGWMRESLFVALCEARGWQPEFDR
jgi:hypothetical protein